MRTYAAFIAEDKKAVVGCILNGDPIKNLKDKDGKKMTDGHLKDKVTELDKQFAEGNGIDIFKALRNARYWAEVDRRTEKIKAGHWVEHDLIETDYKKSSKI